MQLHSIRLLSLAGLALLTLVSCATRQAPSPAASLPPAVAITLAPGVDSILVPPTPTPGGPSALTGGAGPVVGQLTLTNQSSWPVCFVYISDPQQDTWGDDWLGSDEIIPIGGTRQFDPQPGIYDLRAENCDYVRLDEQYGVDLSGTWDWQVYDPAVLYYDSFDELGGWQVQGSGGRGALSDGSYLLQAEQDGAEVAARPGLHYDDLVVTVEATPTENGTSGSLAAYGVMCRVQSNGDGYLFQVRTDGQYALFKREKGVQTALVDWTPSEAIYPGSELNVVEGTCAGDTLAIRVNGLTLERVSDNSFTSGDVGLNAVQMGQGTAQVLFDDLVVTAP